MQRGKIRSLTTSRLGSLVRLGEPPSGVVADALNGALKKSERQGAVFVPLAIFEGSTDLGDAHAFEALYVLDDRPAPGGGTAAFFSAVHDFLFGGGLERAISAHGEKLAVEFKAANPQHQGDIAVSEGEAMRSALIEHREQIAAAFPARSKDGCFVVMVPHRADDDAIFPVARMSYDEFFEQIGNRVQHGMVQLASAVAVATGEAGGDDDEEDDDGDGDGGEEAPAPV
jgi:hypothetical protein